MSKPRHWERCFVCGDLRPAGKMIRMSEPWRAMDIEYGGPREGLGTGETVCNRHKPLPTDPKRHIYDEAGQYQDHKEEAGTCIFCGQDKKVHHK